MNETQTNAPEAQEVAPAAAPAQDVQQPALVAPQPEAKVKGKFDEQLGLMLPSDAAQVQAQLSMPGMNTSRNCILVIYMSMIITSRRSFTSLRPMGE